MDKNHFNQTYETFQYEKAMEYHTTMLWRSTSTLDASAHNGDIVEMTKCSILIYNGNQAIR